MRTGTRRNRRAPGKISGFTLIEIMISIIVLSILVIGIYSALASSQNLYVTGVTRQTIQDRVRTALEAIAAELRQGSSGSGAPVTFASSSAAGDESVTFCMCTGFAAGAATYGVPITITTIDGDGETDNGLDDNRNRMVDERKIVRRQVGRKDIMLGDYLKEGTLRFTRIVTGGLVETIRVDLTLQGVDSQGRVIEASGNVLIEMRNP